MVKVTNLNDVFFQAPDWDGLEEVTLFPDGIGKKRGIPNSTAWVFSQNNHRFRKEIHGGDIGCGMTATVISVTDIRKAADQIYNQLRGTGALGRGNHFVDICSPIDYIDQEQDLDYLILFIHTHGLGNETPRDLQSATQMQQVASRYRVDLGGELANVLGTSSKVIGDWPHNTVERDGDQIIYRKGVVKVSPEKVHFLPAHLGAKILIYTTAEDNELPHSSMPHATGRSGPRGEKKVSLERAAEVRQYAYIPPGISDASLRTEHPSCYNDFEKVFSKLRDKGFVPLGESEILAYIGKT
jgi:hypothetical protein